jgi:hypothetical protein
MLIIPGIIASSYPRVSNSYESIATVTVGAGGSSSADFTSISNAYKQLQIRYIGRGTAALDEVALRIRFNSDTGSNYARHILEGNGASASAFAASSGNLMACGSVSGSTATASAFGAGIIDILDYTNTNKNKTIRVLDGIDRNGGGVIDFTSGLWINTNAITSISLFADSGNLAQYSSFALYGVKG